MFRFQSELLLRLQQQFVSEHEAEFKSIEDLIEAFMTQYNRGDFNDTIEMKLRDLYEAAKEADTTEESKKLYNKILALCPDEVDAKRELIALELHPSFQLHQLKQLVESLKKPKKMDWHIIEARPYMRCLIDMGMIYLEYNMYNDAIACFTPVFHGDKQDHSGFLVYMMVACCGARYINAISHVVMIYKMHLIRRRISCCRCICCIFYWLCSVVKVRLPMMY